ncbi:MAG TPA: hypothetical protein VEV43_14360 [Actinomycetota bacterium]|nr:hypothetical protein [Actinomycetota bacterium]
MRFIPVVVILLALVAVMGGLGREGFRATGKMVLTIVALLVGFVLFYLVVARAI